MDEENAEETTDIILETNFPGSPRKKPFRILNLVILTRPSGF